MLVNLNEKIFGHSFTIGWLLDSLKTNDEKFRKLHDHRKVKDVSYSDISGGRGLLSVVAKCVITFEDSINPKDVYTTVLKIPGFETIDDIKNKSPSTEDVATDANKKEITETHQIECNFYANLAPILDIPMPKVYKTVEWILGQQEGCIHMEDMTLRGKTLSAFENISLSQVKCFIRHLARWHKNILVADEGLWRGKYPPKDGYKKFLEIVDKMGRDFAERSNLKARFDPLIQKYQALFSNQDFLNYVHNEGFKALGIPSVLVHGDIHPGNIMWSINSNGDIQNDLAAILDWQLIHEGSPMEDLARFLLYCPDGIVRRQAEQWAIEYYLECLEKEFGSSQKVPYTLDQLKKAYSLAFVAQGSFTLGIVPFLLEAVEKRDPNESLIQAYRDYGALKALHTYEDFDRLLTGELKDVFDKFAVN